MAVSNGTVHSVQTLKTDYSQALQVAEVLFTVASTQTYAQADNGILSGVPTLIQNSRRNGKTVTLVGAAVGQTASKASDGSFMSLKTVAVSTNDVTFEITDNSHTVELANGAVPAQSRPFSLIVSFYET